MIMKYAMEGKTDEEVPQPNGQFFMDEAGTRAAATEVLGTHKGLKGQDLKDYIKTYFPRTWAHFDVNKSGVVGVEVMPQFIDSSPLIKPCNFSEQVLGLRLT